MKHFTEKEFACKCGCGFCKPHPQLIAGLEKLREKLSAYTGRDTPIIINSGCRCKKHNESNKVNGKPNSLHLKGTAADIKVNGVTPSKVAQIANTIDCFKRSGIIWYDGGWTHVDVGRITPYHTHCTKNSQGKTVYIPW